MSEQTFEEMANAYTKGKLPRLATKCAFAIASIGWLGGTSALFAVAHLGIWGWALSLALVLLVGAWSRLLALALGNAVVMAGVLSLYEAASEFQEGKSDE